MYLNRKFLSIFSVLALSTFCFLIFIFTVSAEADEVGDLFDYCVKRWSSEKATLTISEQPDSTGFFKEAYLEVKGLVVENARIDSAFVSVSGLQLNPPSEWSQTEYVEYGPDGSIIGRGRSDKPNVKFDSFKSCTLIVNVLESDINSAIKGKNLRFSENGRDFILHDMTVSITANGIKITGFLKEDGNNSDLKSYAAAWLLGAAADDYPVTINSKLKIVNDKEIWLDNPTVEKGNYAQLDSYIERNITKRNKPILDLGKYDLSKTPITIHDLELKDGGVSVSTPTLPKALKGGINYTYPANKDEEKTTDDKTDDKEETKSKENNNLSSSSSSSGCNAGVGAFGVMTFIFLASVFFKKR